MCGIAGLRALNEAEEPGTLARLLAALAHRGPDDGGSWSGPSWNVGMRRLAIVDVAHGQQPMRSADGRWVVVLNGEIYNHRDLRKRLMTRGTVFHTSSDTEVLTAVIAERGVLAALREVEGMFAFAAVDVRNGDLWLARDRFGEKPLYLDRRGGGFAFCSELAPLLTERDHPRRPSPRGLASIIRFGHPWPGSTAVEGIEELRPASWLRRTQDGQETTGTYFALPDRIDEEAGGAARCGSRLVELLDASVRERLVADVPLGLFLSGGIDSGAVAAAAARGSPGIRAVTVGFDERAYDETPLARATATAVGIRLDEEREHLAAFSPGLIDDLLGHYGQPFADTSAVPTRAVSRAARRHFKVVLSGDGGDELLAGYLTHQRVRRILRLPAPAAPGATLLGALLPVEGFAERPSRVLALVAASRDGLLPHVMAGVFTDRMLLDLAGRGEAAPAFSRFVEEARTESARIWSAVPDKVLAMALYELSHSLPQDILAKVDRMSMAESLEVRAPFLDSALATYAISLPTAVKLEGGVGKAVLRHGLRERLPAAVLAAPKRGFSLPVRRWLGERFWQELDAEVDAYRSDADRILDPDALQKRVGADRERARKANEFRPLHRAFTLYTYLRWRRTLLRLPAPSRGSARSA